MHKQVTSPGLPSSYLKSIYDEQNIGLAIIDEKGVIQIANPQLRNFLDRYHQQSADKNIFNSDFFKPIMVKTGILEPLVFKQTLNYSWEVQLKDKNGAPGEYLLNLSGLYHENGDFSKAIFTIERLKDSAQQTFRQSELRFRLLFNESPFGIIIRDIDSPFITYVNKKFCELFGYSEEEVQKKETEELIFGQKDWLASLEEATSENGTSTEFEKQFNTKSGRTLWAKVSIAVLTHNGRIVHQAAMIENITEQKKAEKALEENEEKYRSIFENSFDAILVLNEKTNKFIDANQQACWLFQYNKDEVVNLSPKDICQPEQGELKIPFDQFFKEQRENLIQNKRVSFPLVCRKANGDQLHCVASTALVGSNGWVVMTIRDITESIEAAEKLKNQSQSLKKAQEVAAMGSWEFDLESKNIDWSDELYTIFGLKPGISITLEFYLSFIPEDYQKVLNAYIKLAILNNEAYHLKHPVKLKDGTEKWLYSIGRAVQDKEGKAIKLTGTCQDISGQKAAESALKESQKNYHSVFENSNLGILVTDYKTNKKEYNAAFLNMFGYNQKELDELDLHNYTLKEDLEASLVQMKKLESGEITSYNVKKRFVKKDGSVFNGNTMVSANYNEDGTIKTSIAIIEELTDSKLAMDALESVGNDLALTPGESFFDVFVKRISETLSVPYVMITQFQEDEKVLHVKSFWKKDKITKDFHFNILDTPCGKVLEAREMQLFNQDVKKTFPGSAILQELNVTSYLGLPLNDSRNKIVGNITIMDHKPLENIQLIESILKIYSSRISAELERSLRDRVLTASEHRYRAIFEHAVDGILILDINTLERVQYNPNLPKLLGYTMEEYSSAPFGRYMPVYQENGKKSIDLAIKMVEIVKEKGFHRFDWISTKKDGTLLPTETTVVLLPPPDNNLIVILLKDISESNNQKLAIQQKVKELNDKNRQLQKYIDSNMQLENFAYIASHDLKEPLRTIGNFTQILKRKYENQFDSSAIEFMDFIVEGVQNMNRLIEDLLTYSRVNSQGFIRENVNLRDTIFLILRNLSNIIEEKNGVVNINNIPEFISSDKTKISQLFQNLIANAIKFHRDGVPPVIDISATDEGGYWKFSISDNGIGIKPEHFDNIFKLFKKLHSKSEYSGTGIGLSLCKQIVEQHDGEIWIDSILNKGTTFHFTLKKVNE